MDELPPARAARFLPALVAEFRRRGVWRAASLYDSLSSKRETPMRQKLLFSSRNVTGKYQFAHRTR